MLWIAYLLGVCVLVPALASTLLRICTILSIIVYCTLDNTLVVGVSVPSTPRMCVCIPNGSAPSAMLLYTVLIIVVI